MNLHIWKPGMRNDASSHPPDHTPGNRLEEQLSLYPHLEDRILRQVLVALHERGGVSIDMIYEEARRASGNMTDSGVINPNVAEAPRGDQNERDLVNTLTRRYAAKHLSALEIDDIVNLTLKREEADKLRAIVALGSVSFRLLADTVRRFCALPEGESQLAPDEAMGIRVGLIRHLISDQLEFIAVAKRYLRIRDFEGIINATIGAEASLGRIGGKAAGMFLASRILSRPQTSAEADSDFWPRGRPLAPEERPPEVNIAIPESYYLRSDVIEDFIAFNGLGEYQNQKYKTPEEIRKEYPLIKSVFRNAEFPSGIVERLRNVLRNIGNSPLIVRSSSLLEDRFGTAFSGKYASIFLANQGNFEKRLKAVLGAIAEVYASALGPDPLLYRREHDLIDYDEDMAVLIQRVVGRKIGPYFAPAFAGVAFSRNEYRWSPRIKREDGLMRLVMGLGTRAVDRVASEFPRMVALGIPTLRHESSAAEIKAHAQRTLDVINLEKNRLESVSLEQLLKHAGELPLLDKLVSVDQEGTLMPPLGTFINAPASKLFITFDKLMSEGTFPNLMHDILVRLERCYGHPVDVEFAHDGTQLYILQCRTLSQAKEIEDINIPTDVPDERIVFTATRFVRTGRVEGIEYIVYVDPRAYDVVPNREKRTAVARTIGRLNDLLSSRRFILIGPGRWGSNDIRLGVPVTYADISKSKMLIEVAYERDGYVPEVSYGTHFFQDLIEADIAYLPLYPNDRRNRFNETFLDESPTSLTQLLPESAAMSDIVRVIDVPAVSAGRTLSVILDGKADKALAYLADNR